MKHLSLLIVSLLSFYRLSADQISNKLYSEYRQEKTENKEKKYSPQRDFVKHIRDIHRDFEREMESVFDLHSRLHDDFFTEDDVVAPKGLQNNIEVAKENDKENGELIVVTVDFPDADLKNHDIKIKAKGNNLEGFVDYKDHKLKFFVINGNEFGTTLEYKQEKNEDSKDKNNERKYTKFVSSLSTQMKMISPVVNLEKTKVNIQDGKLIIKLPSAHSKQDWTEIFIEKDKSSNKFQKNSESFK